MQTCFSLVAFISASETENVSIFCELRLSFCDSFPTDQNLFHTNKKKPIKIKAQQNLHNGKSVAEITRGDEKIRIAALHLPFVIGGANWKQLRSVDK